MVRIPHIQPIVKMYFLFFDNFLIQHSFRRIQRITCGRKTAGRQKQRMPKRHTPTFLRRAACFPTHDRRAEATIFNKSISRAIKIVNSFCAARQKCVCYINVASRPHVTHGFKNSFGARPPLPCRKLSHGRAPLSDEQLVARLARKGIRVRPLSAYFHDRPQDRRCLVVNYSGLKEDVLAGALEEL